MGDPSVSDRLYISGIFQGLSCCFAATACMGGRHKLAMLEVLELPELVASLRADNVENSVRLLAEDDFANQMRDLINKRSQRLLAEQEVSDRFVDFLASLRDELLKAHS